LKSNNEEMDKLTAGRKIYTNGKLFSNSSIFSKSVLEKLARSISSGPVIIANRSIPLIEILQQLHLIDKRGII